MYVSLLNWVSVAVQNQPLPRLRLMLFLMQRVLIMDSGVICFWMIHSIFNWNKNDKSLLGSSFRISGRLPSEFRFWISELMVKAKIKLLECTIPNSLSARNLESNMSRWYILNQDCFKSVTLNIEGKEWYSNMKCGKHIFLFLCDCFLVPHVKRRWVLEPSLFGRCLEAH